jgi:hypothetical protein
MKTWAENRRRYMEALGAIELADMFNTIVKLCELDEQIRTLETGYSTQLVETVENRGGGRSKGAALVA